MSKDTAANNKAIVLPEGLLDQIAAIEKAQQAAQEAYTADLAALREKISGLESQNAELKSIIAGANKVTPKDKPVLPKNPVFTLDGQKYRILLPQIEIPRLGVRTAAEILLDKKAQEALVRANSSVIKHEL